MLHLIRPLFAIQIIRYLPRSHVVYEQFPDDLSQINNDIQNRLFLEFKQSSTPFTRYVLISVFSLLLDILTLIYDIYNLNGDNSSITFFLYIAFAFVAMDLYVIFYYYTLKFSFPEDIWTNLTKIAGGTLEEAKVYITNSIDQMNKALR